MKSINVLAIAMLFCTKLWGGHSPSIVGAWKLLSSENPKPNGELVSYCTGVHGMILYTADGYMSVALNCAPKGSGDEPADVSGRKFFYAGTYEFDGKTVTHHMHNASDVHLIGKSFDREVTLNGNELVLSGENQGQKFSAYWEKLSSVK